MQKLCPLSSCPGRCLDVQSPSALVSRCDRKFRPFATSAGCLLVLLLFSCALGRAQTPAPPGPAADDTPYAEIERGPNHSVLQQVLPYTDLRGQAAFRTNRYTALASGMHYWANGQWLDASAAIQITPEGGAATNAQHQVFFPTDIAGGIDIQTPDGQHLIGRPAFLSYLDYSSGTNILLAEITNSTGSLVSTTAVTYPSAFTDTAIDVTYENRLDGLEQNVVLKQQLPDPGRVESQPANRHAANLHGVSGQSDRAANHAPGHRNSK